MAFRIGSSNTPQGAGGVGGLLSISAIASGSISDTFYPAYDGNGNVSEYVNAAGAEVAHFEYDPFGNLTVDDQGNAASFPYRFSTKPQDAVTGLYYYGYRYYDPVTGRWPSRDPIGERGGVNLYGFVRNDGVGRWDFLGLDESKKVIAITKVGEPKLQGFDLGVINPNDPNVIDVTKALGISVKELVKKLIGEEGQAIICTSHVDFIKQMEALKLKANFGWPIWNLQKYVRKRRS